MNKRGYQVTLDVEKVKKVKSLAIGGKLSPILNELLEMWLNTEGKRIQKTIEENKRWLNS